MKVKEVVQINLRINLEIQHPNNRSLSQKTEFKKEESYQGNNRRNFQKI